MTRPAPGSPTGRRVVRRHRPGACPQRPERGEHRRQPVRHVLGRSARGDQSVHRRREPRELPLLNPEPIEAGDGHRSVARLAAASLALAPRRLASTAQAQGRLSSSGDGPSVGAAAVSSFNVRGGGRGPEATGRSTFRWLLPRCLVWRQSFLVGQATSLRDRSQCQKEAMSIGSTSAVVGPGRVEFGEDRIEALGASSSKRIIASQNASPSRSQGA